MVEDALSADFCILSMNIPNVMGIVNELASEGKNAVQDYWIRDSVDVGRILPWYMFQIGQPSSSLLDGAPNASIMSALDVQERDIHELVVATARYGALFSVEGLYRYLARKVCGLGVLSNIFLTYWPIISVLIIRLHRLGISTIPISSILTHEYPIYERNWKQHLSLPVISINDQ